MAAPINEELRLQMVKKVLSGVPRRVVAKRYGVSEKSLQRYVKQYKETKSVAPKAMGGDRRSHKIESYYYAIIAILEEKRDRTLKEIATILILTFGEKARFGISTLWQIFYRHNYTRKKKTGHAAEQRSPAIDQQRGNFIRKCSESLRRIYIDETGVSTKMTRSHGRSKRGERLDMAFPHGRRLNFTCVAAITDEKILSSWTFKGAMNTDLFVKWIVDDLSKKLKPGDVLVMDNLSVHKTKRVRDALEKIGVRILFLPPYSPDFNPIEKAFAKLKALLRAAEKRTVPDLIDEITKIFDSISSEECKAYFRCCINQMKKVRREYLAKLKKEKADSLM